MRKRHQRGCLQKISGSWVAQWREVGRLKKKALGRTSEMTKSEAMTEFDVILASVNGDRLNGQHTLEHFMDTTYLPFYKRKWKASTAETNESRVRHHILGSFGGRELSSFTRVELQDFLDAKAESLSYSVVDHLKWDLRQILELGKAEGSSRETRQLFSSRHEQHKDRQENG